MNKFILLDLGFSYKQHSITFKHLILKSNDQKAVIGSFGNSFQKLDKYTLQYKLFIQIRRNLTS